MLKRLSILIMTLLLVVPALAQPQEGCECVFGPKAGQWQFNFNVGTGQFFNDFTGLYYMLPEEDGRAIGLGIDTDEDVIGTKYGLGNAYISGDLSTILANTGSLNYTLKNFSVGAKYFITDHININLSGAYIMNIQPGKDFIEGESFSLDKDQIHLDPSITPAHVGVEDIYASKAILGAVTNRLMVQLGSEYYFNTKNQRIFPYLGIFGQFKMARIESYYPYTGMYMPNDVTVAAPAYNPDVANEEVDLWLVNRGGQALGFGGGINFGIEYALMEGLFIGAEVAPVCYQYTLLHLQIAGQDPYYAMNHNLRAFAYPQLTIGVRF
jgi:hypothetical protein